MPNKTRRKHGHCPWDHGLRCHWRSCPIGSPFWKKVEQWALGGGSAGEGGDSICSVRMTQEDKAVAGAMVAMVFRNHDAIRGFIEMSEVGLKRSMTRRQCIDIQRAARIWKDITGRVPITQAAARRRWLRYTVAIYKREKTQRQNHKLSNGEIKWLAGLSDKHQLF